MSEPTIVAFPRDRDRRRVIVAYVDGAERHRDRIDTDDAGARGRFVQRLADKLAESADDLAWLDELIVERAEVADHEALEAQDGPEAKPLVMPVTRRLSDIEPEAIRWLWPGRIALGKLTLLAGDPGLGKSLVTLDVAARVTLGSPWPDDRDTRAPRGSVVLVGCEDDLADTVRPRLDAAGADVRRVITLDGVRRASAPDAPPDPVDLERDLGTIEEAIRGATDCRLLIVDPISAFLGPNCDSHSNADVRRLLGPLAALAERQRVAVLLVSHLNKAAGGAAIYRTMGSLAFGAAARAAWGVSKCKDDDRRRLLVPIKSNLAADVTGLAFRIEPYGAGGLPVVAWEPDPIHVSADEALSGEPRRPGPSPKRRDEAAEFLRDELAAGPRAVEELKLAAEARGLAWRTVQDAKRAADIESFRPSPLGPWLWRRSDLDDGVPDGGTPDT